MKNHAAGLSRAGVSSMKGSTMMHGNELPIRRTIYVKPCPDFVAAVVDMEARIKQGAKTPRTCAEVRKFVGEFGGIKEWTLRRHPTGYFYVTGYEADGKPFSTSSICIHALRQTTLADWREIVERNIVEAL